MRLRGRRQAQTADQGKKAVGGRESTRNRRSLPCAGIIRFRSWGQQPGADGRRPITHRGRTLSRGL